ncbi:MAG: amidohydrolase family protein [Dehalococcoidia bacterium]
MTEIEHGEYIDVWVNLPAREQRVLDPNMERWFAKSSPDLIGGITPDEMFAKMDAAGIEKGLLTAGVIGSVPANPFVGGKEAYSLKDFEAECELVAGICRQFPGRLYGACLLDPTQGMNAVRMFELAVRDYGFRAARLFPAGTNIEPDHPMSYLIYAKSIELGVPVSVNIGVPGPVRFARYQRPIDLDEVLVSLPEAKIVATHVGHPWHLETIAMLQKHANFSLMTTGWAPRHLPPELIEFMNTRGKEKVLWSADYPVQPFDRCVTQALELPLRDGVIRRYMRDNALRIFNLD